MKQIIRCFVLVLQLCLALVFTVSTGEFESNSINNCL
jgi:hypothetical protein